MERPCLSNGSSLSSSRCFLWIRSGSCSRLGGSSVRSTPSSPGCWPVNFTSGSIFFGTESALAGCRLFVSRGLVGIMSVSPNSKAFHAPLRLDADAQGRGTSYTECPAAFVVVEGLPEASISSATCGRVGRPRGLGWFRYLLHNSRFVLTGSGDGSNKLLDPNILASLIGFVTAAGPWSILKAVRPAISRRLPPPAGPSPPSPARNASCWSTQAQRRLPDQHSQIRSLLRLHKQSAHGTGWAGSLSRLLTRLSIGRRPCPAERRSSKQHARRRRQDQFRRSWPRYENYVAPEAPGIEMSLDAAA
jgi:hypothetical protein